MGRPKRTDLPEGIGKEPDDDVAKRAGITRQAVQHLRRVNDIPPTREPYRSQFMAMRDLRPEDLNIPDWDGSL